MLSRVCARSQIYILDEFNESKMYPSKTALAELERLNSISFNSNPPIWEQTECQHLRISSFNCRSLKKHYQDIQADSILLKSDLISLQETWLDENDNLTDFYLQSFELKVVSRGHGKGIATYFKSDKFTHVADKTAPNIQMSKFTSDNFDLITLYRPSKCPFDEVNDNITSYG